MSIIHHQSPVQAKLSKQRRTSSRSEHRSQLSPGDSFQSSSDSSVDILGSHLQRLRKQASSYDYQSEQTIEVRGEDFKAFPNREGYDENFLGRELSLPTMTAAQRAGAVERTDLPGEFELPYTHFTIVMDKERRQARFTAVNIDGAQYKSVKRKKGWAFDARIPREFQLGNEAYGGNNIDRGHMVRRRAPMWGPDAALASSDTFVYTNAGLQHAKLNQEEWLDLENRILDTARNEGKKMTVFTGPVFHDSDPSFDNRGRMESPTQMPQEFWKVVVWNDENKGLQSEAFVMSQKDDVSGHSGAVEDPQTEDDFKMYRVPLKELEAKTQLTFGSLHNECEECSPLDLQQPLAAQIPTLF